MQAMISTLQPLASVNVVHSPACHFCDAALLTLDLLGADFRLDTEFVAADEAEGLSLVAEHRAPMYPLVLLDGQFFSSGRLPARKLRKVLESRTAAVA